MFIFRFNIGKILLFVICLAFSSMIIAQDKDKPSEKRSLRKTASFADEAVGVQTKGELQNITMNYGQVTDTRYADVGNAPTELFFNFRYPRENFTGVSDDFTLFFAIKENSKNGDQGNVIDGWTENNNEDWVAKDGAYGKTHYNSSLDPTPHDEILYNGQTPYLAHSDLVDTWPVDANGDPFWPGIYRRDPATGKQVIGEFASDRDIYMEFDDKNNQNGDVLGIEVHEMAYTYGRVYAQDILFYEFWIINKSGKELKGCYTGFYQDPDCSDYGEEELLYLDTTLTDGSRMWALGQRDSDGDLGGATTPNSLGITEDYTFGTVLLETPKNVGLTDFHYFTDAGPTSDTKLWAIISSDITNANIAAETSKFFHGSDVHIDDVNQVTGDEDLVWIISCGPFDMAIDDTVKLTVAVTVGDNDADYYRNVWQAKALYDTYFNGPVAPPSPTLTAVPSDGKITLYWDDIPEAFTDPSSGEQDFEGYKIYRSEDGGTTWGTKITDAQGGTYGYVPVAQFDVVDNYFGTDPLNPLFYFGDNSGLQHIWVDSSVTNGIEYTYTIVSYDRGTENLYALESARGAGIEEDNFVTVVPKPDAIGLIPAQVESINHTSGSGDGEFNIEIYNSSALTDYTYQLTFENSPATAFTLRRMDNTNTILYNSEPVNDLTLSICQDGFTVGITTDTQIGGLKSITDEDGLNVEGANNISADGSWYVTAIVFANGDVESKSTSYTIVFSADSSIAYTWGLTGSVAQYRVPFYAINQKTGAKVCTEIKDLNNNAKWDEGETIFITRAVYPDAEPAVGTANPATAASQFAYQVVINNAPGDGADNPPKIGTHININSYNSLSQDDVYTLKFSGKTFDAETSDLSKIRVVPNPYIVVSKYESEQNIRNIKFMYLPPACTIHIYTVSGVLVKTLYHDSGEGMLSWNLVSDWDQALAFGVYVYVVEDPSGNKHISKFALIK